MIIYFHFSVRGTSLAVTYFLNDFEVMIKNTMSILTDNSTMAQLQNLLWWMLLGAFLHSGV